MTLFLTFYFPQTNRMLLGHCCMYFCLYLFLWNIIIIEKKKKNKGFSNLPFETGPIITFNYFNVLVPCAMLFHFTCMSKEV